MSSSDTPASGTPVSRLLRSARAQWGTVLLLVVAVLAQGGAVLWLATHGDDLAQRFLVRAAVAQQSLVDAQARELLAVRGAALPLEWDVRALEQAPHTRTLDFSRPEPWGRWLEGQDASLVVKLAEPAAGDLVLRGVLHAFVHPAHPRQRLELLAGGRSVGRWTFDSKDDRRIEARIPAGALEGPLLRLTFVQPDARAPEAVTGFGDPRRIGVGLVSLQLAAAPVP
jgi:hypothetical protein